MTHQDIIKMLEQEWRDRLEAAVKQEQEKFSADLIEYGKAMAAVEREACAKVCAEDESGRDSGGYYAEIIRERSQQ